MFTRSVPLLTGSQVHVCSFTDMFFMYTDLWVVFFFHTKYTKIAHYYGTKHIDIPEFSVYYNSGT